MKSLNHKGLSLVEVIVSTVIIALVLAGIYASYINARNMVALAYHKSLALVWAESGIEELKSGAGGVAFPGVSGDFVADKTATRPAPTITNYGAMQRMVFRVNWTE